MMRFCMINIKARQVVFVLSMLAACLMNSGMLLAQDASVNHEENQEESFKEEDLIGDTLLAVEVYGRRPIATRQSLKGRELQALSSTSVADALKYFAGVQIKDYGGLGGLKTINVRSLGAQHV